MSYKAFLSEHLSFLFQSDCSKGEDAKQISGLKQATESGGIKAPQGHGGEG